MNHKTRYDAIHGTGTDGCAMSLDEFSLEMLTLHAAHSCKASGLDPAHFLTLRQGAEPAFFHPALSPRPSPLITYPIF